MSNKNEEKPKSILEALGARGEETGPEPTTEEHVMMSLGEAGLMDRLESEQYPEGPPQEQIREKAKAIRDAAVKALVEQATAEVMAMTSLPETEKQITPASNIAPPPATAKCTQALQAQEDRPRKNENLRRLIDFVNGEMYSINWVRMHLMHISRIPNALPSPTLWKIPGNLEVAKLVYDVVLSPGYVENLWPTLEILMGSSVDSTEWCAGVLTTLALFDSIRLLPYATTGSNL
jgi:hypothetical protein